MKYISRQDTIQLFIRCDIKYHTFKIETNCWYGMKADAGALHTDSDENRYFITIASKFVRKNFEKEKK